MVGDSSTSLLYFSKSLLPNVNLLNSCNPIPLYQNMIYYIAVESHCDNIIFPLIVATLEF